MVFGHASCPVMLVTVTPNAKKHFAEDKNSLAAPVRITVQWSVRPQESGPIMAALHALMVAARAEHGCVGCRLSTDLGTTAGLRYVEEWKEEADLVRQVCSDRFGKLAELMETAIERPTVEFSLPDGVRGLEYAEEVRGQYGKPI